MYHKNNYFVGNLSRPDIFIGASKMFANGIIHLVHTQFFSKSQHFLHISYAHIQSYKANQSQPKKKQLKRFNTYVNLQKETQQKLTFHFLIFIVKDDIEVQFFHILRNYCPTFRSQKRYSFCTIYTSLFLDFYYTVPYEFLN